MHLIFGTIEGMKILLYFICRDDKVCQVPLYPHKEYFMFTVYMLVEIEDVSTIHMDEIGNGSH